VASRRAFRQRRERNPSPEDWILACYGVRSLKGPIT
jgi:hypothetical protein